MKLKLAFIITFIIFVVLLIMMSSCNPCKQLAKHPECIQTDTIKLTEKVVHYETEYVIKDSVIRDTIKCDPANPITIQKTIYQTKLKTIIDTIYTDNSKTIINPINLNLQIEKEKLTNKNKFKGKVIWIESILLLIIALLVYLKTKLYI